MIKIAVISDMHCMHSSSEENKGNVSTYLYSDDVGKSETRHPIKALKNLIEREKLSADILLCPGDIANRADKQGLLTGWTHLEKIRERLAAKCTVATVGNHDIESRNEEIGNVFLDLQILDPEYPIPSKLQDIKYWSSGYSFVEIDDILVLNINSCFFQSNSKTAKKSKIDIVQLEAIGNELTKRDTKSFLYKIVLIHHHPIAHSNLDYEDVDKLDKGDELITLVKKYGFQFVLHGHKHDARLTVFKSIPIFCAGSFSSLMNVTDLKSDNTFHMIYLCENEPKGCIKSWIYAPQEGWVVRNDTRFPCFTGFGFSGTISDLGQRISTWLDKNTTNQMAYYDRLKTNFPELDFLGQDEQKDLSIELLNKYDLEFSPPLPNMPKLIIKQIK
ncbi:3',5'-cyclic adenosine monophosphate phosphodiesterase CpdA [Pedobacter sp. Bi27]|uniref:metallophosphoesterase family protein n=1 Tax=Pedobacter sp. Bi27 TaxID=2822351 RepID=UPI001DB7E781|nr:metallophosphoesterase [Pedobacter sp. Bi27]CAH0316613.1 3',5'-cyclic adenosine monophosphate phosphodiesterase CpdA [Pedobacter sp. Bi27]